MLLELAQSIALIRCFALSMIMLALMVCLSYSAQAQTEDIRSFQSGTTTEREISGQQKHRYTVSLSIGQLLQASVEQEGADVVVTLFGLEQEKLLNVNLMRDLFGQELVLFIAPHEGVYTMEIMPTTGSAPAGKYTIKGLVRDARELDKQRQRALELLVEARQIEDADKENSQAEAIRRAEESLKAWRTTGEQYWEAYSLHVLGRLTNNNKDHMRALELYLEALKLRRYIKDIAGEVATLNNLGVTTKQLGDLQKALDYYQQSITLSRDLGDKRSEARALVNMGMLFGELQDYRKSFDCFKQAEAILGPDTVSDSRANILLTIGLGYDGANEFENAMELLNRSLRIFQRLGDKGMEASVLHDIANVYNRLDDRPKAIEIYESALRIWRSLRAPVGELRTLRGMGEAYHGLGDREKALTFYNQSLEISRRINSPLDEATTLIDIGLFYMEANKLAEAARYIEQSIQIQKDQKPDEDELFYLGLLQEKANNKIQARELYARDLARSQKSGNNPVSTYYHLASIDRDLGHFEKARSEIEAAINIIETLRSKYTNKDLSTAYFASFQAYYELYIDLLMGMHMRQTSQGFDGEALRVSERRRARVLLETLNEAKSDIREGIAPELLEREKLLQQQLSIKAQQQIRLLASEHSEEQARALSNDIDDLTSQYQQNEAQIRKNSPHYAALTQPQPLSLKEIQTQVLDADTVLLEYSLGAERSYLWAVTPTSITSYELPKRDEIETMAREVYALLSDKTSAVDTLAGLRFGNKQLASPKETNASAPGNASSKSEPPTVSSPEAATRLSQMLLAPVAAQLGNKRLLIVADGALLYIPFGALPSPTGQSATGKYQPLIIDHEIVTLPSASTLAVLRQEVKDRKPAAKTVAVLADPVFASDDERVSQAKGPIATDNLKSAKSPELPVGMERVARDLGLKGSELKIPRLPGTRDEARQILALVPAGEGKQALDFSASRQTAMSVELSQYRYVHFATHGFLDSLHPELSGIVFSMVDEKGNSQDGFLRAHEVFNLKLPAELIVLSACQTGLGKEVKGEGLVGLTRGFMYAGAPRVVVSLWSVNDQATAELMARFYRGMLQDKFRPAAALRAAQVSLMKEKRWASPFYWAAFTLQGEWR